MEGRKVLIIAAHPDDELLGCGGTARLHVKNGDDVHAVIVCEGESHRYGQAGADQAESIDRAGKIIGYTSVKLLGFPDQTLDTLPLTQVISAIEEVVDAIQPHIVYCQYGGDVNRDHKVVFEAVLVASRPTRDFIEAVLTFDTASSTEWAYPRSFVPDSWVDISGVLDEKLSAMACYESEVRPFPHPRSLEGLAARARSWGVQSCMPAAEVFMTIRQVKRNGKTPV